RWTHAVAASRHAARSRPDARTPTPARPAVVRARAAIGAGRRSVRDNALMAATPHRPGHGRLPVIQQGELAECGLACLAMVARYHGHDVDLAGLRRRFPVSLKGV